MQDSFAIRLLRAQSAAGITQNQLAKAANLSPSMVCLYQQGVNEPTVKSLVAIARALNVSTDYLCGLKETP